MEYIQKTKPKHEKIKTRVSLAVAACGWALILA
jgi:hypothetical protein